MKIAINLPVYLKYNTRSGSRKNSNSVSNSNYSADNSHIETIIIIILKLKHERVENMLLEFIIIKYRNKRQIK